MKAIGPHPGEPDKGSARSTAVAVYPVAASYRHWQCWRGVVLLSVGFPAVDAGAPWQAVCFTESAPAAALLAGGKASAGECRAAAEYAAYKVLRIFFCLSYISFANDLASVRNKQAGKCTQHSMVLEKGALVLEKGALDLEPGSAESF